MQSILIADDHRLVRDTIAAYLSSKGGFSVRLASSADEAFALISLPEQFDLAIFDYQMPGMNGLDGLAKVKKRFPALRTALMSGVATREVAEEAAKLGALAYFPKSMPVDSMLRGIRQVLSGEINFVEGREDTEGADPAPDSHGLTPREVQILKRLALGQSNKLIAEELRLKEVTVKFHVTNIMNKLGVSNRTQAALLATKKKII